MRLSAWILFIGICVLGCIHNTHAQDSPITQAKSNLRFKSIPVKEGVYVFDTLSVVPGSFSIEGITPTFYQLEEVNALIKWLQLPSQDSVKIQYRVFPFKLTTIANRMNYDSLHKYYIEVPTDFLFVQDNAEETKSSFDLGNIQATGSIGRQIGFGNRQDAVVNSTLNLQLNGMIGDSIEIAAALTDNNIPIQPDGTTQQLNEFDQVYLQFKKKNWQLSLGDIDIRENKSYFLNFYKRLQGMAFSMNNSLGKNTKSETLVSGSIAKGKFTRNIFQGLEGNQGPYRLTGANNELFFILLPNTERVFVDGVLLQRGEDQDYIINYNTAEVTFMPRKMITKDSRIQIEFEYAERSYLNANLYLSQEFTFNEKLKLRLGAFNNSDARNSQINQTLDAQQRHFLSQVGDSIQNAFYPSAVIDTFATDKILYEKIYIGTDSIYQYSVDPAVAKYHLSFVNVGEGKGNYVPDFNGANGKVYTYVVPVAGIKQGSYEPVQILVTPKSQQLINLGVDYAMNKNTTINSELAMSRYDVNTFSKIDNGDDNGFAAKFQVKNKKPFAGDKKWVLESGVDYEYVQAKFKPLERLRNIEFSRDWGLSLYANPATENIIRANANLTNKNSDLYSYQFTTYHRSDEYSGFQNAFRQLSRFKGWQLNNELTITNFKAAVDNGYFLRPVLDLSKQLDQLKKIKIGARYELEHNRTVNKFNDSLTANAFSFDNYSFYIKTDESKLNKYGITFFTRTDKYIQGKKFIRGDRSYNLNLAAELLANENRKFYFNTTFRKLQVLDKNVSAQEEDETILGRAEYLFNEWEGLLAGNVLYEVGAGQEQKRDFSYLEVPAGVGQYAWVDYNEDGIQQLNEFELAAFTDQAKFIRVFTPTNDYTKANYITFNYSLTVSPKSYFGTDLNTKSKRFLAKWTLTSGLQLTKKSVSEGRFAFNPFDTDLSSDALLNLTTILQNTLSYNRFHSIWGFDINNLRNKQRSLLTYGYESRSQQQWNFKFRWNLQSAIGLTLNAHKGLMALYTPEFENRNYEVETHFIEPAINYVQSTRFRISTGYRWEQKNNLPLYGGEKALSHQLKFESKYVLLQNSSITGKFTYNQISFNHPTNTTVSYTMLEGLMPGKNLLWTIQFTKRLLNNLELSIEYDGRKAGTTSPVHIGKASITALF